MKRIFAVILCIITILNCGIVFSGAAANEISNGNLQISIPVDSVGEKAVVVAYLLDGSRTVEVVIKKVESNTALNFSKAKPGDLVKIYLWKNLSDMQLLDEIKLSGTENDGIEASVFYGKTLYVDGDSICCGKGYNYGKLIADKYGMNFVTNAAGGATLSMGVTNAVKYGTELDWENKQYYLKLPGFNPMENKDSDGFAVPITKEIYENGYGVYPTAYRVINGELVEQEYSETMPASTFFVKFDMPTYDGHTVPKYYRMWKSNSWLWEAYKSGFEAVHKEKGGMIGEARHCLSKSVNDIPENVDYIILEGGINDYTMNRRIGELSQGMEGVLDTTTTIGGLEYICRRIYEKNLSDKVIYLIVQRSREYTTKPNLGSAGSKTWQDYHDAIVSVLEKYDIEYVDLFETEFDTAKEEYLQYTVNKDGVHPTKEGYEKFYIPYLEQAMAK